MRKFLFIFSFCLPFFAAAQMQRSSDIFPNYGNYERKGWLISPALTYTLKPFKDNQQRIFTELNATAYDVAIKAKGKLGVGLEIGRFYAIENSRIISYVDFSLGIKMLRGAESFEAVEYVTDGSNPSRIMGEGVFSQNYATASFNVTNARPINKNLSLHNTLGINADYRVTDKYDYFNHGFPITQNVPERFLFQAHYKLGFGYMISNNLMLIPSVETPIITFYEYDDLKSTLKVFNSRYRPLIFRLTIMILDKKADRKCPDGKRKGKTQGGLFGSNGKRPW